MQIEHKISNQAFAVVLLVTALLGMIYAVYSFLPVYVDSNPTTSGFGVDWKDNIRFASLRLVSGMTPYTKPNNVFPPWIYLLIAPVAVLPKTLGTAVIFVLSYAAYVFVLQRLGAKPLVILAFVFCKFAYMNALNGNLDFLAVLGFVLPPQFGLFFVAIKPQIGAGIALFWLVEAWHIGRFRQVVRIFAPVTIAYLLSFVVYGLWPLRLIGMPHDPYNASLWPVGIPVAIILLYKSFRSRNKLFAIAAAPFLAPYTNITSFAVTLFPFIPQAYLFLIGVALSWL